MSFQLSPKAAKLRDAVAAFSEQSLRPGALTRSQKIGFPRDVSNLIADKGWGGLASMPVNAGGGILAAVAGLEAMARHCPRAADAFHQLNFGAALLLHRYATGERQRKVLSEILSGDCLVAIAVTEDEAGAQAAATKTAVTRNAAGICLSGHKAYCTNSAEADAFVIYSNFGQTVADIGAVLVERGRSGLSIGDAASFMNGESWCRLDFDAIALSADDVIFPSGGFVEKAGFFDIEKLGNAARALGLGWCAYDHAREHVVERRQFGRSICEFQGIQWKFAEAFMQLEAAQMMLYRAAARADAGSLAGDVSSIAKIHCNRAAMAASDMAVQVMGAAGFSGHALTEYCFRKARGHMINGGTIELMLTRIAESVFDRKFPQQIA